MGNAIQVGLTVRGTVVLPQGAVNHPVISADVKHIKSFFIVSESTVNPSPPKQRLVISLSIRRIADDARKDGESARQRSVPRFGAKDDVNPFAISIGLFSSS